MTWVDGAAGSLFDVDNLPYGVFSRPGEEPRVGVRIGDHVLDVAPLAEDDRPVPPGLAERPDVPGTRDRTGPSAPGSPRC